MKRRKGSSRKQKGSTTEKARAPTDSSVVTPGSNGSHAEVRPPGEIVLYRSPDGRVDVTVHLKQETVWLTQQQIAHLLGTTQHNVSMHLKNIYEEQEVEETATYQDFLIVQTEGSRTIRRPIAHYNLDAIIAVGYRVNSRRGTQFRIWATRTLREHLLRGYTLNEKRLRERGLSEIQHALALLTRTVQRDPADTQSRALLDVIERYSYTWRLLVQFDEHNLADRPAAPLAPTAEITPELARTLIARLHASLADRGAVSPLFGRERTAHLDAILGAIEQTFDAKALYPSVQARAAHLLYFVIKDHPFADGNRSCGPARLRARHRGLRGTGAGDGQVAEEPHAHAGARRQSAGLELGGNPVLSAEAREGEPGNGSARQGLRDSRRHASC